MFRSINYTLVFAWLIGICYGFVLISSATKHNADINLFRNGESLFYQLQSVILLGENGNNLKNVGFYIAGQVSIGNIWEENGQKLLKIEIVNPHLNIRSRKAPSPDGFIQHSSKLEEYKMFPFYVVWVKGMIDKILIPKNQAISLANLQKGIASLFQFLDTEHNETDSSGSCHVTYRSIDDNKVQKTKTNCVSGDLPYVRHPNLILDTVVASSRIVNYEIGEDLLIKSIESKESHKFSLAMKTELCNYVEANQLLTFVKREKIETSSGTNLEQVLEKLGKDYTQETLLTEKELNYEESKSFSSVVAELRDGLKSQFLGSLSPAKAFIRLLPLARKASKEDIIKVLDTKKNVKILPQIYDILGFVQTVNSHQSVMKKLYLENEDYLDLSERYLWALSIAPHPNSEIILDLLKRYRKTNYPDKVKETILLTIAAMTSHLDANKKLTYEVEETILNGLEQGNEEERYICLRALKNLKSPKTIPDLLQIIKNGTRKEGVLAFKALKAFHPKFWDEKVKKTAQKSLFQLDRKYDSSSRTIAVDILLESSPTMETLREMLHFLKSNDSSFEVKQYIYQQLQRISEEDPDFGTKIQELIKSDPTLNNYSTLAIRGLSTTLKRSFLSSSSSNGSLLTIQEVFSGIAKRGIVNIMMEKSREVTEMFSLGIFSGGLSSFMSSNSEDEETATAGMELTILGTQIRPFVFFNGQGELMGHVWSGTASEKTTAYQALVLLQDHSEFLRLGPGFIAELDVKGAVSFDLSGKIEISLWNRNAESLVEKSAGIIAVGFIKVDTTFVRSQVEFTASIEPKLSLKSDIDFSGNMNLCMRVTQPDCVFRHNIFKIERIPGSKHKLRIAKYKKSIIPGSTYSLNKKNNNMCSVMFKDV